MSERDKTIDGYRAVAALGVVFSHAVDYRFHDVRWLHYPQRLADPLSQLSVQLFFVISGYIITTLLLKERDRSGSISIAGFYTRRICRIIPPFAAYLLFVSLFGFVDAPSGAMAATFTCNIGECSWYVAHTWSLSVEEQFYLAWPMLLIALGPRPKIVAGAIGAMLLTYLITPALFHSNYISFTCIGFGALYAMTRPKLPENAVAWLSTAALLVLGPPFLPARVEILTPPLIVYLLFSTPPFVKALLAKRPFQIVGLASYSLYLWQQPFLAQGSPLPLWGLPAMVALSVLLIEQPFIALGRRSVRRVALSSPYESPRPDRALMLLVKHRRGERCARCKREIT